MRIISGCWKGRRLGSIRGTRVRPTTDRVKEAWMSAMGGSMDKITVLDLFSGTGALGLEALSRGASSAVFVEHDRGALSILRGNIELLGAWDKCMVVEDDVFHYLDGNREVFDLALADPPYGTSASVSLVSFFLQKPFARELWLEHRWGEELGTPDIARTRRYGDTALTTLAT